MHLSRAIVPAEKLRLFSRKNEDKKGHRRDSNPRIHTRKAVELLTGLLELPTSFLVLNI